MQMTSTMASSVTCRAACQGKERKTPSCFPLTDSQSRQLSVCIWDWLTDCTPPQLQLPSNTFSIKAPGKSKVEGNTEKRTFHKCGFLLSMKAPKHEYGENWWEKCFITLSSVSPRSTAHTQKHNLDKWVDLQRLLYILLARFSLFPTNIQAKLGYSVFNFCIAYRIHFRAGWADKNSTA